MKLRNQPFQKSKRDSEPSPRRPSRDSFRRADNRTSDPSKKENRYSPKNSRGRKFPAPAQGNRDEKSKEYPKDRKWNRKESHEFYGERKSFRKKNYRPANSFTRRK